MMAFLFAAYEPYDSFSALYLDSTLPLFNGTIVRSFLLSPSSVHDVLVIALSPPLFLSLTYCTNGLHFILALPQRLLSPLETSDSQ